MNDLLEREAAAPALKQSLDKLGRYASCPLGLPLTLWHALSVLFPDVIRKDRHPKEQAVSWPSGNSGVACLCFPPGRSTPAWGQTRLWRSRCDMSALAADADVRWCDGHVSFVPEAAVTVSHSGSPALRRASNHRCFAFGPSVHRPQSQTTSHTLHSSPQASQPELIQTG
jgi:hypothetical protein